MKKILVPTDFSECSYYAVEYAASIARKTHAQVYLLHIIETAEMSPATALSNEWLVNDRKFSTDVHSMMSSMQEAKRKMEEYKVRPELGGIEIVDNIEVGNTEDIINSAASRYDIDLIILCAHGSGGENSFFIGSNAEKVIRGTDKPVLTLKNVPPELPKTMLFASDFSDESGKAFSAIRNFATLFGTSIHFVKINTLERFETTAESENRFREFARKNNVYSGNFTIYNDVMVEAGIISYAQRIHADIIALETHGKHRLTHLFAKSLTEELINHSKCPILTVNAFE